MARASRMSTPSHFKLMHYRFTTGIVVRTPFVLPSSATGGAIWGISAEESPVLVALFETPTPHGNGSKEATMCQYAEWQTQIAR